MQVVLSLAQGGSETLARDIALAVGASKARSSVCALDTGGPLLAGLHRARVPVHILGRRPGFDWRLIPRLYRLFRREAVDIVQTHHLAPLIYAAIPARLAGARLVHVEHERFSFGRSEARRRLRILSALCDRIVVVGPDIRDFFERSVRISPSKLAVIRNGVDVERYSEEPSVPRSACGLVEECRLIGHVARLDSTKDQATLLRAFQLISQVHPNTRLVIVGDGPERQSLEDLTRALGVSKQVDFLGQRNDVPALLPHFDVFALSSRNEGLSIALLEAMAAARPVTCTAVGEAPAIIDSGVTGLLVPANDAKSFADAVISLLDRPEWACRVGRSARELVARKFSLSSTVGHYEALYRALRTRRG